MQFIVDTRADINVLSKRNFSAIQDVELMATKKVSTAPQNKALGVVGMFRANVICDELISVEEF